MTNIDEAMLIAWVDGELDEVTRRRVNRAVADDPALAARLEMHRRLRHRLSDHYAPIVSEPVPSAMEAPLRESAKVVTMPQPGGSRWRNWGMSGAIAASLLLGVAVGQWTNRADGPVLVRDGAMLAGGQLKSALDTQLASAQDGASIRIGLSFRRKEGGWCRSFDGDVVAGVACREGEGWRIQQLLPGGDERAAYRQAASGDPRIMATVDALIAGDPADARQEAAARAGGWR
ncbi:anti-sigma factor family protein [Sphingobium vermicomposti]|uniref:Anti-sigma factor n=1 Tax=Sphingobium vermicomposti TaxID=529005 RepID=A0A846M6A0_9SPHN|nr:anti-sigma factor [Sphingobium vermicomposti]NIJ16688.1 hypothetical protein [Sphingobium vermicomposti]